MTSFAGLASLLVVLSDPDGTSPEQRRQAERSLRRHLTAWLPPWIAKRFPQFGNDSIVCEDILDHILDRATTGTQRFRAAFGDRSAYEWVTQVARNRAIDAVRRAKREVAARERIAAEQAQQAADDREAREAEATSRRVFGMLRAWIERQYSPSEQATWSPRIEMAFEIIWIADGRALLAQHGYVAHGECDEGVLAAADNRAAQHRRRARVRVSRALAALVSTGQLEAHDAATFAALNRIPWPPPARASSPARPDREDSDE